MLIGLDQWLAESAADGCRRSPTWFPTSRKSDEAVVASVSGENPRERTLPQARSDDWAARWWKRKEGRAGPGLRIPRGGWSPRNAA